jgi:hypothetical protein
MDKKRVFGDDPRPFNRRQRNKLGDLKFSVNSRMLYHLNVPTVSALAKGLQLE